MHEARKEFLVRKEKASLTARQLPVSLDRADAFIEGGAALTRESYKRHLGVLKFCERPSRPLVRAAW